MMKALQSYVAQTVKVRVTAGQTDGMCFAPLDALNAQKTLGADVHIEAAKALRAPLLRHLT